MNIVGALTIAAACVAIVTAFVAIRRLAARSRRRRISELDSRLARFSVLPAAITADGRHETVSAQLAAIADVFHCEAISIGFIKDLIYQPYAGYRSPDSHDDRLSLVMDPRRLTAYDSQVLNGRPFTTIAADGGLAVVPVTGYGGATSALLVALPRHPLTDRDLSHLQFHASCVVTPLHAHTADGRLRESLGTTRTLLKAHASSLVTLDRRGTVVDLEPGRDAIAVRPADTRAPQRGDDYLHWCQEVGESGYGDATVLRAALEAIYAGAITTWQREFPDRDAAPERWFEVTARTSDPPDTRTMVIWRDITARKRIELALRENERHFRVMVDAAPTMVWLAEADRRCTYFNRAWLDFTGRTLQQEVHSGWLDNMHQDDVARCREVYDHAFEAMEGFSLEYRLRRRDGAYRWIMETAVPWRRDDGSLAGFIGSAIDITERREAEEVARELSGRLIVAQEEERRRIAREVHDDCGQRLALLAIELEQLASQPPASHDELASRSGHMARAAAELATDLHRLSHRLHPAKLEALGLVAAIQGFCHELSSQHGLRVQFTHQGVTRTVPSHVALCLYRIVQEGLQNVVKHSGVMKADVRLSCRNRELVLQIADPGHGFDLGRQPGAGLGLNSMQERVRSLGGQLVVHTSPGRGTRIGVRVNLDTPVGEKQTA